GGDGGHQVPPPVLGSSRESGLRPDGDSLGSLPAPELGPSVDPELGSSLGLALGSDVGSSGALCSVSRATICSASARSSALMLASTRDCTNGGRSASSSSVIWCCRDSCR